MSSEIELTDRSLIDFLRRSGQATVGEMVEFAGVTATAIRHRLNRLMEQGLLERDSEAAGRGRPTHYYRLSAEGSRVGGNNYEDLATILWDEIRAIDDAEIRRGLLKRIAARLVEAYQGHVEGGDLEQRMASLVSLMGERDVAFEVRQPASASELPVLTALACPYPDLAEQDRGICAMEKMLLSEILGEGLRLSACRLDGGNCCDFEVVGSNS